MYKMIDLCCGTGALSKSFERTGEFETVMYADIDPNFQNLIRVNRNYPQNIFGDISDDSFKEVLNDIHFDVLLAGVNHLNEKIFFEIFEIIESKKPMCFVLECDETILQESLIDVCHEYFSKEGYFVTKEKLNPIDFGIKKSEANRIFCVGLLKNNIRVDLDFVELTKKKYWSHYDGKEIDFKKNSERRGFSWCYPDFHFLIGTGESSKNSIIDDATYMPMACSVALDILFWLK